MELVINEEIIKDLVEQEKEPWESKLAMTRYEYNSLLQYCLMISSYNGILAAVRDSAVPHLLTLWSDPDSGNFVL